MITLYLLVLVSVTAGDYAWSFSTKDECEEQRVELMEKVDEGAPLHNDFAYVSQCEKVELKGYGRNLAQ